MELSKKAISDLRLELDKSYGNKFSDQFTDEELDEIGMLCLTLLAEGLKMKVKKATEQKACQI